jgi:hypothetical protein
MYYVVITVSAAASVGILNLDLHVANVGPFKIGERIPGMEIGKYRKFKMAAGVHFGQKISNFHLF